MASDGHSPGENIAADFNEYNEEKAKEDDLKTSEPPKNHDPTFEDGTRYAKEHAKVDDPSLDKPAAEDAKGNGDVSVSLERLTDFHKYLGPIHKAINEAYDALDVLTGHPPEPGTFGLATKLRNTIVGDKGLLHETHGFLNTTKDILAYMEKGIEDTTSKYKTSEDLNKADAAKLKGFMKSAYDGITGLHGPS